VTDDTLAIWPTFSTTAAVGRQNYNYRYMLTS